jgi:hypothetical protein
MLYFKIVGANPARLKSPSNQNASSNLSALQYPFINELYVIKSDSMLIALIFTTFICVAFTHPHFRSPVIIALYVTTVGIVPSLSISNCKHSTFLTKPLANNLVIIGLYVKYDTFLDTRTFSKCSAAFSGSSFLASPLRLVLSGVVAPTPIDVEERVGARVFARRARAVALALESG